MGRYLFYWFSFTILATVACSQAALKAPAAATASAIKPGPKASENGLTAVPASAAALVPAARAGAKAPPLEAPAFSGGDLYAATIFDSGPALKALPHDEVLTPLSQRAAGDIRVSVVQESFLAELERLNPGFLRQFKQLLTSHNPVQVKMALNLAVKKGRALYESLKETSNLDFDSSFKLLEPGGYERSDLSRDQIVLDLADSL